MKSIPFLEILHFNDCYAMDARPNQHICGGCSRFVTLLSKFSPQSLKLFSGDLWAPSKYDTFFSGEQLVVPVNSMNLDVACIGNHDFEFGPDRLEWLNSQCNFPWLMSNLVKEDGTRYGKGLEWSVVKKGEATVGVIGLIEWEWMDILTVINVEEVVFEDFALAGTRLAKFLREEKKCDVVIALTHMRMHNDRRLAEMAEGIDLILGGHDHIWIVEKINNVLIVKSGTDFLGLSHITLTQIEDNTTQPEDSPDLLDHTIQSLKEYSYTIRNKWRVTLTKHDVTVDIPEDKAIAAHIVEYNKEVNKQMQVPLCYNTTIMDTKFSVVRTQEASICNFIVDLIRRFCRVDICMLNGGTFRADRIIDPGVMTYENILAIVAFNEPIVVKRMKGSQILKMLENGVSKYPSLDGRFLHSSRIAFTFSASAPPLSRISTTSLTICGEPYSAERLYTVAMTDFMSKGKEGFDVVRECPFVRDGEEAIATMTLLSQFFKMFGHAEYLDEYELYKEYKEVINDDFIERAIQSREVLAEITEEAIIQKESEIDEAITYNKTHPESHTDPSQVDPHPPTPQDATSHQPLVKLLTRANIDAIISGDMQLSSECLQRISLYYLVKGIRLLGGDGEKSRVDYPLIEFEACLDGRIKMVK